MSSKLVKYMYTIQCFESMYKVKRQVHKHAAHVDSDTDISPESATINTAFLHEIINKPVK